MPLLGRKPEPAPEIKAEAAVPTIGRIVLYRSKRNPYDLPAIIVATTDSLWEGGVERGDVPGLFSDQHVHLVVLTPGALKTYHEYNIPLSVPDADGTPQPGSWRWPEIRG